MEASRKTEIGKLQMSVLVDQHIVRFDVPGRRSWSFFPSGVRRDKPMYIAEVMNSFDGQYTLRHVKACNVFGEHIVLHQHRHEVAAREKLHDKIQIERILE